MTARWAVALLAGALVLAGCGGSAGDDDTDASVERATQGRAYATVVSRVTERTRSRLAEISRTADYRDAAAASASTRAYADGIGSAATDLDQADPPPPLRRQHGALVALYRQTAVRMQELSTAFASARGDRALAGRAQELSAEIQQLSTRETQLRRSIERALAEATTPTQAR